MRVSGRKPRRRAALSMAVGAVVGYLTAQQACALALLVRAARRRSCEPAPAGEGPQWVLADEQTPVYRRVHTLEGGIERITVTPTERRFETPLLLQHGMWHGAWCWHLWQGWLAEWGWESIALSLPGHGLSPVQRPIRWCTLDYYLGSLRAEVERLPRKPVILGHSMGGALVQWYLREVGDDLPAAVLLAPWTSHSMIADALPRLLAYDPLAVPLMTLAWDATPMRRRGKGSAVRFLVGPSALLALEELQPLLGPESALVLLQHNPPFWRPPERVRTPLLWLAAEDDPLLVEAAQRRSAHYYGADYGVVPRARHDLMLEWNTRDTALRVHRWLVTLGLT